MKKIKLLFIINITLAFFITLIVTKFLDMLFFWSNQGYFYLDFVCGRDLHSRRIPLQGILPTNVGIVHFITITLIMALVFTIIGLINIGVSKGFTRK